MIENQDALDNEAKNFENYVQVTCQIDKVQIRAKRFNPNKQKKSAVDLNNKSEITGLYRNQKHRAIQEILFGPTTYCTIDPIKIEKCYEKKLTAKLKCNIDVLSQSLWNNKKPSDRANSSLMKDFTPKEIKSKLLTKIYNPLSSSRSMGLDRISFHDLRKIENPDYSRMTLLFNACLKLQTVPKIWMEFYSVLIKTRDKNLDNSDADDNDTIDEDLKLKNWHPITMQRTVLKLFQSLIAARLIVWAKNTGRLSETQKGFLMHDAACESSFILQQCKSYAEDKEKSLAVAWLDFTDASEFIPQPAVLHALEKHSVPSSISRIIQKMLEFSNTKIRVMAKNPEDALFTKSIQILKGLPQGSPLNPILLDLVIEPILRDLTRTVNADAFELYNKKINHYAIPNELTLIADSPCKLQNLLNLVEKNAKLIGLKFKIHKCSAHHYDGKTREVKLDSKFVFFGQKLSTLPKEKVEEYFGVKQGLSIGQEGFPSLQEMIDSIELIDGSKLEWYQKIESILMYVIPRVENYLRGLESADTESFGVAEKILKDKFKMWLNLPEDAATKSIVYHVACMKQDMNEEARKCIKYNYLPFMDLFDIMKVVHALKMLTSQDEIVKTVALVTLTAEVNNMIPDKKKINVQKQHLAQYLSGDLNVKNMKSKSLWCTVREATSKLKLKIPLTWQYNNGMQLTVKSEDKKQKLHTLLSGKNSYSTEEKLKKALVEYYINDNLTSNSGPSENLKAVKIVPKKKNKIPKASTVKDVKK